MKGNSEKEFNYGYPTENEYKFLFKVMRDVCPKDICTLLGFSETYHSLLMREKIRPSLKYWVALGKLLDMTLSEIFLTLEGGDFSGLENKVSRMYFKISESRSLK